MAETLKILGQAAPIATTETTLYTVPALTSVASSSIIVCNRGASATFRISVSVGGAATSNKDYIAFDETVGSNKPYEFTIGITLAAADVVRVYASSANLSFNMFGTEIT